VSNDYPAWLPLQPIQQWPRDLTATRVRSPFSATWGSTTQLLRSELRHLGVDVDSTDGRDDVVLQIAIAPEALRLDGRLRSRADVAHPGVILAIESRHGPLSYACDRFTTWRDNLRAIALALEALRKVDRYGIGETGQQYTGWQQLPAGGTTPSQALSVADAERVLREQAGAGEPGDSTDLGTLTQAYRRAVAATHPDRPGGSREAFDAVQAAADVLRNAGQLRQPS
jgi:hypothetical protein